MRHRHSSRGRAGAIWQRQGVLRRRRSSRRCAGGDDPLAGRRVDLDLGPGPAFLLESAAVLRRCPKPTVALLHGHALGSGYDYSLSCDFRVATEDVNYGDPRIHRRCGRPRVGRTNCRVSFTSPCWRPSLIWARPWTVRWPMPRPGASPLPGRGGLAPCRQAFLDDLATLDADAYAETKARALAAVDLPFEQALRYSP